MGELISPLLFGLGFGIMVPGGDLLVAQMGEAPLVYLDMNIYNRIFDDQSQPRIKMESIAIEFIFGLRDSGMYDICWSFVLEAENRRNRFLGRRDYVAVLSGACRVVIEPSPKIKDMANYLTANSNIKASDALHIASAMCSDVRYFLTCDDKLIKAMLRLPDVLSNANLKIMNPIDFLRSEVDSYDS